MEGGWDLEQTVAFAQALRERDCAALHVSSGGFRRGRISRWRPVTRCRLATRLKAEIGLPTIAVGLITEAEQAEAVIANGEADAIALARAILYDPRWPWHAAAKLGAQVVAPKQYLRSQPREYPNLFAQSHDQASVSSVAAFG